MDQRLIDLYDDYTHRHLDRRLFLERAARLAGGSAAAAALLPLLQANAAAAGQVPTDDDRLQSGRVEFPGAAGPVKGYLARPKGDARLPGIVVIHENRGLNPHIEDVARRAALAGFVALAPDLLSGSGGTPADEQAAMAGIKALDRGQAAAELKAAIAWLRGRPDATGKVGAVGFCWGGGMANLLATASDIDAVTVFYGAVPAADAVARIKAPLLLNYAGLDTRINADLPAYEAALKKAGVRYTLYVYEGVNHAFHNDTSAARYDATAAKLAWQRTIAFFDATLKSA
ncbi:MAG: dienelactone hydrolase family protein [Dongiaceae bacterium]